MFAGHIKMLGGPHVARGPDVAHACSTAKTEFVDVNFYLVVIIKLDA